MSELLLKGATMTNAHCDTCGDPIFRYDGQEFCPTCNATQADTGEEGDAVDAAAEEPSGTESAGEPADAPAAGGEATAEPAESSGEVASAEDATAPDAQGASPAPSPSPTPAREPPVGDVAETTPTASADAGENGHASLTAARASLVRTLARFSRQAEATDDPRRAREYLRAAHEAADTLAALDR